MENIIIVCVFVLSLRLVVNFNLCSYVLIMVNHNNKTTIKQTHPASFSIQKNTLYIQIQNKFTRYLFYSYISSRTQKGHFFVVAKLCQFDHSLTSSVGGRVPDFLMMWTWVRYPRWRYKFRCIIVDSISA